MSLCSVIPRSMINTTEFFNVTYNCAVQIKRGMGQSITTLFCSHLIYIGDRGSTVVKVLCYKSEGRWFDPSWCQRIFH